ncbi:MAG: DUF1761 domain-containing protein [Bacilli bacterium]|nr:DUF1761 domain-containing protein [Bacilli bacterium]
MKKEKGSINISINSKDETKSQIIYNNVISNMDKMALSKEEQLDYLKSRITELEQEHKNKLQIILLTIIFSIILAFGLFLIIQEFYTLGVIISFTIFFASIITIYKLSKNFKNNLDDKYEEIETIRKLINSKLK